MGAVVGLRASAAPDVVERWLLAATEPTETAAPYADGRYEVLVNERCS